MRKTLKWVATENNLFTLINKDVYATVEENNYKGEFDKRWILSFRKYNGIEPIGNPTANLYFDTLEEVFNKINEYNINNLNYSSIKKIIADYWENRNSDIVP